MIRTSLLRYRDSPSIVTVLTLMLALSVTNVCAQEWEKNDRDWTAWPFDRPFYLILNIAVGGTWGGQQGVVEAAFPAQMEVDFVRVYRDETAASSVDNQSPEDGF